MSPDMINAAFEFGGIIATIPSILKLHVDKCIKGFSIYAPMFFTSWGWWNLFYYPHLDQVWSAYAAAGLTLVNSYYLAFVVKYWRKHESRIS